MLSKTSGMKNAETTSRSLGCTSFTTSVRWIMAAAEGNTKTTPLTRPGAKDLVTTVAIKCGNITLML
jgi:hypothetical protein